MYIEVCDLGDRPEEAYPGASEEFGQLATEVFLLSDLCSVHPVFTLNAGSCVWGAVQQRFRYVLLDGQLCVCCVPASADYLVHIRVVGAGGEEQQDEETPTTTEDVQEFADAI